MGEVPIETKRAPPYPVGAAAPRPPRSRIEPPRECRGLALACLLAVLMMTSSFLLPGEICVSMPLESCHALVLNADYRPLSYFPLSLWPWQIAVKAAFLERVNIVSEYDLSVHSPNCEIRLPSVIALKQFVPLAQRPSFTRFNVFLRDRFTCQYCSARFAVEDLTFDHVVPRSRGGHTSWDNVVTACSICNLTKGDHMPNECSLNLRHAPRAPSTHELHQAGREFPPRFLHQSWCDYLYWDAELDEY